MWCVGLSLLGSCGCTSASATDGEQRASTARPALALPRKPDPVAPAALPRPPAESQTTDAGDDLGSEALEQRLDRLEHEIEHERP
ncbi:MAG TPA: hypothetical protein VK745_10100 [Polyangiaceae bacterium]|nr:hypothetical protein [Polyangiaceae bacterium]